MPILITTSSLLKACRGAHEPTRKHWDARRKALSAEPTRQCSVSHRRASGEMVPAVEGADDAWVGFLGRIRLFVRRGESVTDTGGRCHSALRASRLLRQKKGPWRLVPTSVRVSAGTARPGPVIAAATAAGRWSPPIFAG